MSGLKAAKSEPTVVGVPAGLSYSYREPATDAVSDEELLDVGGEEYDEVFGYGEGRALPPLEMSGSRDGGSHPPSASSVAVRSGEVSAGKKV